MTIFFVSVYHHFFQLHVSLSSDLVTEYHEEFSLTTASFIGQLGGILNLWIGISFFTIIEIIDLLFRLLQTFAKRPQREKESTDKITDKQVVPDWNSYAICVSCPHSWSCLCISSLLHQRFDDKHAGMLNHSMDRSSNREHMYKF